MKRRNQSEDIKNTQLGHPISKHQLPQIKLNTEMDVTQKGIQGKSIGNIRNSVTNTTAAPKPIAIKRPITSMGNAGVLNVAPIYRIAQPYSAKVDMNARLWQESTKKTRGLIKNNMAMKATEFQNDFSSFDIQTNYKLQKENDLNHIVEELKSQAQMQSDLTQMQKPFHFLSSIGGTMLNLVAEIPPQPVNTQQARAPRPQTVSTISRIDFNSMIMELKQQKLNEDNHRSQQFAMSMTNQLTNQEMSITNQQMSVTNNLQVSIQQMNTTNNKPTKQPRQHTKSVMNNLQIQNQQRPMSTINKTDIHKAKRIQSANIQVKRPNDEAILGYELAMLEQTIAQPLNRPQSSWIQSRPISGRTANPQQFFQVYTKFTNLSSIDMPFEELFDRNERTLGATFARFGDLGYYSPIQRIGVYMQFSAKLKQEHLQEIIDLLQSISKQEKEESEAPIQLTIIEELNPFQKRHKTGINSGKQENENQRLPISLSLFPEYFEDVNEQLAPHEIAHRRFEEMVEEMGGNYDPAKLGFSNQVYVDPSEWPPHILKRMENSLQRYWHYIMNDLIKQNEVPRYNKQWMMNAFSLVDEGLLQNESSSREVFQEIFEDFKVAMKRSMLDYILRSPEERKRLHITLLPREWLCSAQRIAREGGFNTLLFPQWHAYCQVGREYCDRNLTLVTPITSALCDWFEDFRHFKLCELEVIKQVSKLGHVFSITEFSRVQAIYRINTLCLLQNIWFRGASLIIRKQTYLRSQGCGKWTFIGPQIQSKGIAEQEQEEEEDEDEEINMIYNGEHKLNYISSAEAFRFIQNRVKNSKTTNINRDACTALTAVMERMIWLENPQATTDLNSHQLLGFPCIPYKEMEKAQRKNILENTSVLMSLQLRQVVEQSLRFLQQQFLSVPHSLHGDTRTNCETARVESLTSVALSTKGDNEFLLIRPSFLEHQNNFQPFLKLNMVMENETLNMQETEEFLRNEMIEIIRNIVVSCDKFLHPRHTRATVEQQEGSKGRQMRQVQFNFDVDMGGLTKSDFDNFYKSYWAHVRVEEKVPKYSGTSSHSRGNEGSNINGESKRQRYLSVTSVTEQEFITIENSIISHIIKHYEGCSLSFDIFDQFRGFIDHSWDKELKSILSKKFISNEEFKLLVDVLKKYEILLDQIPNQSQFPIFLVNMELVIVGLRKIIVEMKDKLFNRFESQVLDAARSISDKYVSISTYIRRSLKTPDDVESMEKYICDLITDRVTMKQKTSEVFQRVVFLLKQNFTLSETLVQLSDELYHRPQSLDKELIEQDEKHLVERQRLEESLRARRTMFENRVDVYCDEIHNFETFTEYGKYKTYVKEIEVFEATLDLAQSDMLEITDQEQKLFGYASQYDSFIALQRKIKPFSDMWKNISTFLDSKKRWMTGPLAELDSVEFENTIKPQIKAGSSLTRAFGPQSIANRVAHEFQKDVLQVNTHQRAIEVLSNPGLRDRHWTEIQVIMGVQFNYADSTMRDLLKKGVERHLDQIEEVSETASKEFSLENALGRMEKEWQQLSLVVINYKNRGVLVLQGSNVEDLQTILDEHCIKAQTIRSNPAIKFMQEKAEEWERLVMYIQQVLDVWVKVQTMFLYLEPIFSFEDISKTLFEESEQFQKVSRSWTSIMAKVESNPLLIDLQTTIPNLLEQLLQNQHIIEEIQRGLEQHLELKRLEFPRFFFLSNDDLISILAEARDSLLIQPHVKKCFEGVQELIFTSMVEIVGVRSSEGEQLMFQDKVVPRDYKSNVEKWLLKLEEEIRRSLKKLIYDSYNNLSLYSEDQGRSKWLKQWPAQCIITSSCINFTRDVEVSFLKRQKIVSLETPLLTKLNEVVTLVRTTQSNILRMMLSALIVLEVHNIDILRDLIVQQADSVSHFAWSSQLRYYLNEEIDVRIVYTLIPYGYEYLGVGTRLVITPLTDRCYRTMAGALAMNLGGAPEGPAGTGKTESVKDLAKAVASQCIVFNCGEGLNAHGMAKFFKGLASSGAWSCFDEFNRIELEVLSVIAQQIRQIQLAKALEQVSLLFEGTQITLKASCNVFITMNPGYAGRSELPDNLKALFRPCAMMVPDYALIAEISLYSFGFVEARVLAKKIAAVYKLCSEQLSSQDHYDYGMRAVKAVLNAAAQLKRKQPTEKEDILVLRAINEVNLPKFLMQDATLFLGIVGDLFPGVRLPAYENKNLLYSMNAIISKNLLQPVPQFKKKVFQLYDMIYCRHGLMLVGQTMSGKSTCYKVLAQTLSLCHKEYTEELPTQYHILNPKSITLSQMYGNSDPVSKEWTEGVLALIYRRCATSQLPDRQFIVFDGPVDADWIENMNTVLDDNKKLCLMNGETIAMTDQMTIMFEVQDLAQASPATVSRCGMVYFESDSLGWYSTFLTQLQDLKCEQFVRERVDDLFCALFEKCTAFIRWKCSEYEKLPDSSHSIQTLRLLTSLLYKALPTAVHRKPEEINIMVDSLFLYSLLWTVGGGLEESGRKTFEQYFKKQIREPLKIENKKDKSIKFDRLSFIPELADSQAYDFYYNYQELRWRTWKDSLGDNPIDKQAQFNQIIVDTSESLRITSLLANSIQSGFPFLIIGQSGVGKTRYINKYLRSLQMASNILIGVNFSATSSCSSTQQTIELKIERRRKGVYGPPHGMQGILFVDDLSMPHPDKYGAQSPLELLRQLLDQGGWYSSEFSFLSIINLTLVAAMSPSGGGRVRPTPRLLRHFNIVALASPDALNMQRIFTTILQWHLSNVFPNSVDPDIFRSFELAIEALVDIYSQVRDTLKATPNKSWYFLNMRDVSRCVQGMTLVMHGKELLTDTRKVARLWLHEVSRTLFDRLHESDYDIFWNLLQNSIKIKLRDDIKSMMKPYEENSSVAMSHTSAAQLQKYFFSDILDDNSNPSDRSYGEVLNQRRVIAKAQYYLDELNANTKKPLNLAIFQYATEHLLKIMRILRMQQGHALLVGLGGSGRQSLVRLACHIRGIDMFQFEVTKSYTTVQWREDLQRLLVQTGGDAKECCFVLADHQMSRQFIMEDVNALLNTGDVPSLFGQEDFVPLIDRLRTRAKKEGNMGLWESGTSAQFYDYFIESGKRKLHIILTLSPVGDTIRNRIRLFPSIVNCTTIDCFQAWPEEALEAVAKKFLSEMQFDVVSQRQIINQCNFMHESLTSTSLLYKQQDGRHNYVTPGAYFGLLQTFQCLLSVERQAIQDQLSLYATGVQKLDSTSLQVKRMERELTEKTPLLKITNEETALLFEQISAQALAMEPKKKKALIEENIVNEKVKDAEVIKQDCEKDLSIARPKLKKAEDALNTLDSNDINSIKAMLKPPETVQLVMEAVCVLCSIPAISIPNPKNPKERLQSYWEASKKFLTDKDFLHTLINYDKENINEHIMKRVREKYISQTLVFNAKRVEKASSAAKGLCEWVLALDDYEKVLRVVRPKQIRYNEAKIQVQQLQASLKLTRDELDSLNNEITVLQNKLSELQAKQLSLTLEIAMCETKLERASQLMRGLGGERDRWESQQQKFSQRLKLLVGDMLISAGAVANLGLFSGPFRTRLLKQWLDKLKVSNGSMQCSENFSLELALANPMAVRKWRINGLPSDSFSTENGIIISRCQRYPLLIDPQGQGNKYIKLSQVAEGKQLKVTKQTDSDFLRVVGNAITFGQSLLIESVLDEIDFVLEGVLQKQTFKHMGVMSIKLGDSILEYNKLFQLFFTTKLRNPHYSPETGMKVTLMNFTITQVGLEDQLLELCVSKEKPDLEEQKNKLIIQTHQNQLELQRLEDCILDVLNRADNILDDEEGIAVLQKSKMVAMDIEERQKVAEFTERKIDQARTEYKPISTQSALIFFAVIALSPLDAMYQYSLTWYLGLYWEAFEKAESSPFLKNRIQNVCNMVTYMSYQQVCRGLFEKDKLLFSLIILLKQLEMKKHLDFSEFNFLLSPIQIENKSNLENPFKDWLPNLTWQRVQQLMKVSKRFSQLPESFISSQQQWMAIMVDHQAHSTKLPDPYMSISAMQRLCILKVLRPDKLVKGIKEFVSVELGEKFIQPPQFSLPLSYISSNNTLPLLFVLPGADPMNALISFAEAKNIQLRSVSLGQGQGVVAEKEIEDAKAGGYWVILQNCHLMPSWMPKLERICEELQRVKASPAFRLWLSSYPSSDLPTSVLQSAIKMTNEPPSGVKANLLASYHSSQLAQVHFSEMHPNILSLLYSLCFFHAIMQERTQFGSLGFNIPYDFNQSDLFISVRQLQQMSSMAVTPGVIALEALTYLVGECNYGGRVTDSQDRRTVMAMLQDNLSTNPGFKFGGVNEFGIPACNTLEEYYKFIEGLPFHQPSQIFGFHPNAEIVKDINASEEILRNTLVVLQGQIGNQKISEDAKSGKQVEPQKLIENALLIQCSDLINKLPKKFDIEIVQAKYPYEYKNSMNTVLLQEILRYNKLLIFITTTLKELENALKGLISMTDYLEGVSKSILLGIVPELWKKYSYPSMKPLGSYMTDFFRRISYFQLWVDKDCPAINWISGFFFTQCFLTATLQNYARKYSIAIDVLSFEFEFTKIPPENETDHQDFDHYIDGQCIYGLYFEGCKWDYSQKIITEPDPKVLATLAPVIVLKPSITNVNVGFKCPVYMTAERRGLLSTTGHSTNFIMSINVPSSENESYWIKRGVAILSQLSD